jgi:Fur family ferric uptake transcriptional regulator
MEKEKELLREYIAEKNLKLTKQRETILKTFLSIEKHISAEELYRVVIKKDPQIGIATVYRTMNLLKECGLAQELHFGDGQTRYEHMMDHIHHDHLICRECGKIMEFTNSMIEKLQDKISREKKFEVLSHKLELYGLCKDCRKKS